MNFKNLARPQKYISELRADRISRETLLLMLVVWPISFLASLQFPGLAGDLINVLRATIQAARIPSAEAPVIYFYIIRDFSVMLTILVLLYGTSIAALSYLLNKVLNIFHQDVGAIKIINIYLYAQLLEELFWLCVSALFLISQKLTTSTSFAENIFVWIFLGLPQLLFYGIFIFGVVKSVQPFHYVAKVNLDLRH